MAPVLACVFALSVVRLPVGAVCPDAEGRFIVYAQGGNAYLRGATSVRINARADSVEAGGERGPKVALAGAVLGVAWQDDYRHGAHVWFARSTDGGKTFAPQIDLLEGKTPGIDHPAIAAQGQRVVVLWLDGRSGPDPAAPTTSTIWYRLSEDAGASFGPMRELSADGKLRACACCSLDPVFESDGTLKIAFRSGIGSVRDIWTASGDPGVNRFVLKRISRTGWKFEGCPMDGPRQSGGRIAYAVDGKCYVDGRLLGAGRYPNVRGAVATWQEGRKLHWLNLATGQSGIEEAGEDRACLFDGADGIEAVAGSPGG